jgi:sulfatase maturation enzyme AslB (radical SAM superfamily)
VEIQSLSICVPAGCPNRCKFCVSRMHHENYQNQIEKNLRFYDLYYEDFLTRLEFVRDHGCDTVVLTGDGEPLINLDFLKMFGVANRSLERPFRKIELQTSGVTLDDEKLRFLRNHVQVKVISLSLSDIFSSDHNAEMNDTPDNLKVNISNLCSEIKRYDFVLRLSLNMTDTYNAADPEHIFRTAKTLGANQLTFRKLYQTPEKNTPEDKWIEEHRCNEQKLEEIRRFVETGTPLEILPFGARKYSVNGIGVVIDDDCMSTSCRENLKYLILRQDCQLYSRWNDIGSLIF